jgi:heme-degrading monooxygenase HmoA
LKGAPPGPAAEGFAAGLKPPYYSVIFTSQRTGDDAEGYDAMAELMMRLAAQQPGYLGVESARGDGGFGITVSYWRTSEDIVAWRRHAEHVAARHDGRALWYRHYELRVALVERAYGWDKDQGSRAPSVVEV